MFLRKKNKAELVFYFFLKFMLNKIFGREGDVLPAHILKKVDKNIFDNFSEHIFSYDVPAIFVTGTNGKTTAANLISETLKFSGKRVCSNSNGANMANGIYGAILGSYKLSKLSGLKKLDFKFSADFIVMECDEKVFPFASSKLKPDAVVVTNFYRDQLDRYGEVNSTVSEIKKSVQNLLSTTPDAVIALPSFEPLAAFIGYGVKNENKIYYGFNETFFNGTCGNNDKKNKEENLRLFAYTGLSDALTCPNCGGILSDANKGKENIFLFKFKCEKCGFANPEPDIAVLEKKQGGVSIKLLSGAGNPFFFKPALSGDYNIANYLAAYSVLKLFNIEDDIIKTSFENFKTKFGRSFKKTINNLEVNVDLVKNPAGFNRVLEKIDESRINVLFAFSDRDADGRDVSWIWDVEFEKYVRNFGKIVIAGTRPFDLAVRLKTAGVNGGDITVEHNLKKAVKKIFQIAESENICNKKIYIMPTYTELLRLKSILIP